MREILVGGEQEEQRRAPIPSEPAFAWTVVAITGLAIAIVGWTDLVLLWYPLHFGNTQWEFGTISAHLDGMPLGTIGFALLAAGAIGRKSRRLARVLALAATLVVVGLLAMSLFYLLDVPLALRTAPDARILLVKAMVKAGAFSITYTVLYAWLARSLWRSSRVEETWDSRVVVDG